MLVYKPSCYAKSNKKKERNEVDAVVVMLVGDDSHNLDNFQR